jgi:two-component system phosphate regulon sensor histidine kinase PhoR
VVTDQPRRDPTRLGGGLLLTADPQPQALQGMFSLLLAVGIVLRTISGESFVLSTTSSIGLAVVVTLLASGLAALLPWDRLPVWTGALLPLLDIAAVGLLGIDDPTASSAVFIVLPAFWLGRLLGRTGALVTLVAAVVLVGIPSLSDVGLSSANLAGATLVPLVASWAALAIASNFEQVRLQQQETERHSDELSDALQVIQHQRRVSDAILDSVDVGLVLLDREGGYEAVNRRHRDFMRLAYPDGHAGRAGQLGQVYGPDGLTMLSRSQMPTVRAMAGEEFDDCRIWVGDDPLTSRALSVSARSVRDHEGRFAGAALAYNDVTDFMRALRVKDDFIASVSHELRTPLTSIRGYADLLLDRDDLPVDAVRQLSVVIRNAERLQRLVVDLLHSAQIEMGPIQVDRTRADLAVIVGDAVAAAAPAATATHIDLSYTGPDRLVVMVDQDRMRQVVDNLLSNAIKYTPPNGRVDVRLQVDGGRVELTVADTGIGIDAADRDRLFTRFWRSRHAEEQSIQGVGLGLSITKSIVESHGGRIEVDSEVGTGSTFRVRVPVDGRG